MVAVLEHKFTTEIQHAGGETGTQVARERKTRNFKNVLKDETSDSTTVLMWSPGECAHPKCTDEGTAYVIESNHAPRLAAARNVNGGEYALPGVHAMFDGSEMPARW